MKQISLSIISLFFALSVMASPTIQDSPTDVILNQKAKDSIQKYLAAENSSDKNELLIDFFNQIQGLKKSDAKQSYLKSAMDLTHKLDSLVVDRWNETSGQMEPAQLEKWTWYENGLGKSWELYDLDTLTKKWYPNDKEEYDWDSDGNKTLHIDFDPDSLTGGWLLNAQEFRTFDTKGNQISDLVQFKNRTTNEWEDYRKSSYTYDSNENLISSITFEWDSTTNEWIGLEKGLYTFDESGRGLKYEYFEWDASQNDWASIGFIRVDYDANGYVILREFAFYEYLMHTLDELINDSDGNEIQSISSVWDYGSNDFVYSLKNTHSYITGGNDTLWSQYKWDAEKNDWQIKWNRNYSYDELGNLIYRDFVEYDQTLDALVPNWKNVYVNNTDGNPTLRTSLLWNKTDEIWLNNYREHYNYDREMRQSYLENQTWDTLANAWLENYKEIHEYDISGNYLHHSKQKYDTISKQWLYSFTDDYTFDFDLAFADICFPSAWPFSHLSNLKNLKQYTHAIMQKAYSEEKNGQLEVTERLNFYYSEKSTTSIPEGIVANFQVFPNPATDYLVFDVEYSSISTLIEIYDLQGRKVIAQELSENHRILVSQLKTGVYVYKLIQGSDVKQGKIIKN